MRAGDDGTPAGRRLDRDVAEGLRLDRGDRDHVGSHVHGLDVRPEPEQPQPVHHAELARERQHPRQTLLGARPRLAGNDPDHAAIA